MSQPDPMSALVELVACLGHPVLPASGRDFPTEDWRKWMDTWYDVREHCSARLKPLLADLRRWLREGLDDGSFAESRVELDAVGAMITALVSSDPPGAIHDATGIAADGTESGRVLVGRLQARPHFERNRALQAAVEHFERWRDCRRNTMPTPDDPAPLSTEEAQGEGGNPADNPPPPPPNRDGPIPPRSLVWHGREFEFSRAEGRFFVLLKAMWPSFQTRTRLTVGQVNDSLVAVRGSRVEAKVIANYANGLNGVLDRTTFPARIKVDDGCVRWVDLPNQPV